MNKLQFRILSGFIAGGMFVGTAVPVFAHAVVKPTSAGIGSFQDFTLGVPSEKDAATTKVQLMIPDGLANITPVVKTDGWTITVKQTPDPSGKKDDDGNPAMITSEIDWTGGQIPAHQKDFFLFSGQVPSTPGELDWKVVQTYADGSVVNWNLGPNDSKPSDSTGKSESGPYSKTMVVNDLKPSTAPTTGSNQTTPAMQVETHSDTGAWILGGIALLVSLVSLGLQFLRKSPKPTV